MQPSNMHIRPSFSIRPAPRPLTFWEPSWRFKGTVRKHKKKYRAALSLDPYYAPAIKNLARSRSCGGKRAKGIVLEEIKGESNRKVKE
jgi:hypothetical protein